MFGKQAENDALEGRGEEDLTKTAAWVAAETAGKL